MGIKQIGDRLSQHEEQAFHDVAEGFSFHNSVTPAELSAPGSGIVPTGDKGQALQTTKYQGFFKRIDWDMQELIKREEYLYRRVELERFKLPKLSLLPFPIDASFARVAKEFAESPYFPELLYLLAEYFPTQAPYKLMAVSMMKLRFMHIPNVTSSP